MKKATKKAEPEPKRSFPPTSVRLDPELIYRGKALALENQRAGVGERSFSAILSAALAEYLKKHA